MPGLIRGVARTAAVVGTASAVSGRVQRRQQGRWAAQDQQSADQAYAQEPQQMQQAPPPQMQQAPPPPPAADDMTAKLDQLKQLGELKDAGVLSEYEFETQKRQILG